MYIPDEWDLLRAGKVLWLPCRHEMSDMGNGRLSKIQTGGTEEGLYSGLATEMTGSVPFPAACTLH